jgi:hypothetical protein
MSPWVAVSISVLSLAVSGTTAYFNFFWIESSASAAVLSFRNPGGGDDGFELDIAVYNTGNRQMAVTRIDVRVDGVPTVSALVPGDDGGESLPVLIEPKELALFRVDVDGPATKPGAPGGGGDAGVGVPIGVRIQAVSSVGAGMRSDLDQPVTVHLVERDGALVSDGYSLSRSPEPFEISEPEALDIEERSPPGPA